jgi:hypothetical protein
MGRWNASSLLLDCVVARRRAATCRLRAGGHVGSRGRDRRATGYSNAKGFDSPGGHRVDARFSAQRQARGRLVPDPRLLRRQLHGGDSRLQLVRWGILRIPEIAHTETACPSPEGVMEQGAAYIQALRSSATYRLSEGRLEITDARGDTFLEFSRKTEFGTDPSNLLGTSTVRALLRERPSPWPSTVSTSSVATRGVETISQPIRRPVMI